MNVTTDPGKTRLREWSLQERPGQGSGVEPAGTTRVGVGSGACGNGQVIDPGALGMGRPGASGRCWRRNRPRRRRSSAGGPGTRVRSSPTVASTAPRAASVAAAIPSSSPPTVDGSTRTASSSSTVTTSETKIVRTRTPRVNELLSAERVRGQSRGRERRSVCPHRCARGSGHGAARFVGPLLTAERPAAPAFFSPWSVCDAEQGVEHDSPCRRRRERHGHCGDDQPEGNCGHGGVGKGGEHQEQDEVCRDCAQVSHCRPPLPFASPVASVSRPSDHAQFAPPGPRPSSAAARSSARFHSVHFTVAVTSESTQLR